MQSPTIPARIDEIYLEKEFNSLGTRFLAAFD